MDVAHGQGAVSRTFAKTTQSEPIKEARSALTTPPPLYWSTYLRTNLHASENGQSPLVSFGRGDRANGRTVGWRVRLNPRRIHLLQ